MHVKLIESISPTTKGGTNWVSLVDIYLEVGVSSIDIHVVIMIY